MKLFCVILTTLLAVLTVSAESAESKELETFVLEQANLCRSKTNASENDVKEMLEGGEPETRTAKCLYSCLLQKLEVMNADNKLVPDKLGNLIVDDTMKSKDGKPIKSIFKDVIEACKLVTDRDECEAGAKISACLNAEAKKAGFEQNVF